MKIRNCAALLLAVLMLFLFAGCAAQALEENLDVAEEKVEARVDAVEDAVEAAVTPNPAPPQPPVTQPPATEPSATQPPAAEPAPTEPAPAALTKEDAEAIALDHAGLTADQLLYLRTELDYDRDHQEYDVEFQIDRWEYDYEIHVETGEILSWDKDWDD